MPHSGQALSPEALAADFANHLAVGTAEGKSAFLILFQCGGNISLQDGALPFLLR